MRENKGGERVEKRRSDIIRSVRTPLGFFALVVLVVEAILGATTNFTSGSDRTFLVIGMLVIILVLIAVVAVMAWKRPYSLYGRSTDQAKRVRADIMLMPTDPKKYDALFHGFSDCDFYAFNPPFKVEGEPGDARFQAALETHEARYRSNVKSHYLFFDRESYSRAQRFFQELEQRLGRDKFQRAVTSILWDKPPQTPSYTFFMGQKRGRSSCILYPSVAMRGGLPEAVVLVEGDDNLLSILNRYFQENWEQAGRKTSNGH
jgi:hypothetical protein